MFKKIIAAILIAASSSSAHSISFQEKDVKVKLDTLKDASNFSDQAEKVIAQLESLADTGNRVAENAIWYLSDVLTEDESSEIEKELEAGNEDAIRKYRFLYSKYNSPKAIFNESMHYLTGTFINKSTGRGKMLLLKAARKGSCDAMTSLSSAYRDGTFNFKEDLEEAKIWEERTDICFDSKKEKLNQILKLVKP